MKRILIALAMATAAVTSGCASTAKLSKPTQQDFLRAASFLPESLSGKVKNEKLIPNWIGGSRDFWFEATKDNGEQGFWRYSALEEQVTSLFKPKELETALAKVQITEVDWHSQPLRNLVFENQALTFSIEQQHIVCDLNSVAYACVINKSERDQLPDYHSPNKKWFVKVENYNLVLCSVADSKCQPLTTDGTEIAPYGLKHPYPEAMLEDRQFDPQTQLDIDWSSDSRYAMTYRLHRKGVNKLTLLDSVADEDFSVASAQYYYPQAGDENLPSAQLVVIDTEAQTATTLDAPFVMQTYYGGALWGYWQGDRYFYHDRRRGNRHYFLRVVNAQTNQIYDVVVDTDDQFIDPWAKSFRLLTQSERLIWTSQRSGYQHLYLYNKANGELINAITKGDFTVRVIRGVDEDKGVVYFEASGFDKSIDPYLRQLFRVNLDGSDLTLLTPEPFEHDTRVSPDFSYFVDSFSDHQSAPTYVVRSTDSGQVLRRLGQADPSELTQIGWQPPEAFKVVAQDGKTALYGLIYKPSNFDPDKRYPIINDTYTGPHNFFTPKSFNTYSSQRNALAELGFIVVKMDGRGTSKRGKTFHRHSYKNLAGGTDDHVWAIKQLALKHDYMDISKVGIFGFSAGGYDVVQAMMRHPEFFKVGVSASGNHEFRVDKAGWNEIWMGWPMTKEWREQSNLYRVNRLQGKLLLGHGELDSNVHPSATMRLVDELIKADKDFEMLIMPKMGHVLDDHPYWVKKRWKFFIEHLMSQ